jgi:hypothetical protein
LTFLPFGIRLVDIADMLVVAVLFGSVMVLMRRTRARLALTGFAFLGVVYLLARQIGLQVTAGILQAFFAVLVIVVVVIFQEDLRRFFEQIASWGMGPSRSPPGAWGAVHRHRPRASRMQWCVPRHGSRRPGPGACWCSRARRTWSATWMGAWPSAAS